MSNITKARLITFVFSISVVFLATSVKASDYWENLETDYRDSYISRHNDEMESINDNSAYEEQIQDLRKSNMRNLYINSKDYRGETIIIEQTDDSVIKHD